LSDSKKFNSFLVYNLKSSLCYPFYYLTAIIFILFVILNFFIRQQFFSGNGTTELLMLFSSVPYISILVIPSICYKKSDSVYDDFVPLSSQTKIFISFLSNLILFYSLVLFLVPISLIINLSGSIDIGQLFCGIVCLFFYSVALISICTFINISINNRLTSFLISAIVLAAFNSIHLISVYFNTNNFISSLCKFFSFAWHFDAEGKGIIDTRDIFFFIGTFLIFYNLSIIAYEKNKGRKFSKNETVKYILKLFISVLILANGQRYYTRIDFSKNRTYSLSNYTKELLSQIDEPLKITYYRSESLSKLYPQIKDVTEFLSSYSNQSKNISLIIKNPDKDTEALTTLQNYNIFSQQLKTSKNNSTEYLTVYSAIVLEYKGNVQAVPFSLTASSLEYDLSYRIKDLITEQQRIVNIIIGNGMTIESDYEYLQYWLNSQGFLCNEIVINQPDTIKQIENANGLLLILGDSKILISEAIAIENYILSKKGNVFFAISPYSVDIEGDWNITQNQNTNIVEMVENWGVTFDDSIAADISCSRITMMEQEENNLNSGSNTQIINYPLWLSILPQENAKLGLTSFWAVPLKLEKNATPYLITSGMSYKYDIDRNSKSKLIETNPFVLQNYDIKDKEKSSQIISAKITGGLNGLYNDLSSDSSNIIVLSDQYFVNSLMIGYIGGEYDDYRNFDFLTNCLLKLNGEEPLAELQNRTTRDTSLFKITDEKSFINIQRITYSFLFIFLPILILLFAIIINLLFLKQNKSLANENKK
jgi:ABC-type uncharacterized transport system involved in gliding motility auxiliary subunit